MNTRMEHFIKEKVRYSTAGRLKTTCYGVGVKQRETGLISTKPLQRWRLEERSSGPFCAARTRDGSLTVMTASIDAVLTKSGGGLGRVRGI